MDPVAARPTAPFLVFYRRSSGDGGYLCRACSAYRHDVFSRLADVCAVAMQHLSLCRAALRHRPIEGVAIVDGESHGLVLREGVMLIALHTVFDAKPSPVRAVT